MAQAVCRWPFAAVARIQPKDRASKIRGGQGVTERGVSPSNSVCPCRYHLHQSFILVQFPFVGAIQFYELAASSTSGSSAICSSYIMSDKYRTVISPEALYHTKNAVSVPGREEDKLRLPKDN
jgi:hypothetical protein